MTLEVSNERDGLRVKTLIITADLQTHSAIQEVDKDFIEAILRRIQIEVNCLLAEAAANRKSS